jgi:hypothetical protein
MEGEIGLSLTAIIATSLRMLTATIADGNVDNCVVDRK